MPWKFPHELAEIAARKGRAGWVNLGDIQPPKPPSRQAEKRLTPLDRFIGKPCAYCHFTMTRDLLDEPSTNATRDHAFPRSAGWRLDDFDGANRVICCYGCNHDKGSNDIVAWHIRLHAGGDPRAPIVLGVINALWRVAQRSTTFPAAVRTKLNVARLRAHIPPRSAEVLQMARDAKASERIANQASKNAAAALNFIEN